MIEAKGNIFDFKDADAWCYTSNGVINVKGENVMGAGNAKAFRDRFEDLALSVGRHLKANGNVVGIVRSISKPVILNFPTKNHWKDPSDLGLVEQSAKDLVTIANKRGWKKVCLCYPAIGKGGRAIEDVRKVISPILDDRFWVLTL